MDQLITSLGNAIYFPYLAPVVILGAIWLAWQGLIRKRATRTIEGTIWMVIACAAAIWLIGRPGRLHRPRQDRVRRHHPDAEHRVRQASRPGQASCVPVQKGDPQTPAGANFAYTSGNGRGGPERQRAVDGAGLQAVAGRRVRHHDLLTAKGGQPTVVNSYGRQLLWAQAIAANEKPDHRADHTPSRTRTPASRPRSSRTIPASTRCSRASSGPPGWRSPSRPCSPR